MWHFIIGLKFCLLQMPPRDLVVSTILSVENGQSLDLYGVKFCIHHPLSFRIQTFPLNPNHYLFIFFNAQLVALALLEVSMHQYILDMQELSLASLLKGYFLLP